MVFTKFDQFEDDIRLDIVADNQGTEDQVNDLVEKEVLEKLKKNCLDHLSRITSTETYPRAVVSGKSGPTSLYSALNPSLQ